MGAVGGALASGVVGSLISDGSPSGNAATQSAGNAGMQIAGGALSARDATAFGNQVAQTADPFLQYRQGLGAQANTAAQGLGAQTTGNTAIQQQGLSGMQSILNDPQKALQSPFYQAEFNQGTQAVNRTLAQQGNTASGAQLQALQDYGMGKAQGFLSNQFNMQQQLANSGQNANQQSFNQLGALSGATTGSMGGAAQAQSSIYSNVNSGYNAMGQGLASLAGNSNLQGLVGGLGNAINGMFSGGSSTGSLTNTGSNSGQTFGNTNYFSPDNTSVGTGFANTSMGGDMGGLGSGFDFSASGGF